MFGYRVPAPDEAMLMPAEGRPERRAIPGRHRPRRVRPPVRPQGPLPDAGDVRGGGRRDLRHQAGHFAERPFGNRVQGRQRWESIVNAGQRFLSDQDQMSTLTGRIFAGHLRSIIGSMTVEEIVTERQKLASEVLDGSKAEMVKIGLTVDSLQIQSIDDMDSGYIDAMAAPQTRPSSGRRRSRRHRPTRRRPRRSRSRSASRPSTPGRPRWCRRSTRPRSTRRRPRRRRRAR